MRKTKITEKLTAGFLTGIIVFIFLIFTVNLFHFNYRMNADIASDVILSELIWNTGKIIPDTWYVANELRMICTPNVSALFYGLTGNMVLASGLACCMMTLFILLSILNFMKRAGLSKTDGLMMAFLCLAFPAGFVMLELLYLFAGYYAVHVVILFWTLSMYAAFIKAERMGFQSAWGILFAFLLGMQGVRGILVIYGPLAGVEVCRNIYFSYCRHKRRRQDICVSLWTVALLAVSYLGTLFPFSVGQGFSRNIRKGPHKLLTEVIPDMGRAIGFESANLPGKICLLVFLVLTMYILAGILYRLWKREGTGPAEWAYLVMCSSPVITALIVAFTTVESTERYYFVLLFLLPFSTVLAWKRGSVAVKYMIGAAMVILALVNAALVYLPILNTQEPPDTDGYRVTEFLFENDLLTAYATFENANTMTVLSNGAVRVYSVATVEKMDICKWMTSTDWYCPNMPFEQKTAYIITDSEEGDFARFLEGKEDWVSKLKEIGKYNIYVSDYNYSNLGTDKAPDS